MKESAITDKEWLDISWKHFLQHAQQRILYFNYFVIFSTILTTGLITTFQYNFQAPILGIGIGLIQAYLSFLFRKIDDRNRFLTKHSENAIKRFERDYESNGSTLYKLFVEEDAETLKQSEEDKSKMFITRQFTHGKSYRIIFATFFVIGLIGATVSFLRLKTVTPNNITEKIGSELKVQVIRIDSLTKLVKAQSDSLTKSNNKGERINLEIERINLRIDSIKNSLAKWVKNKPK